VLPRVLQGIVPKARGWSITLLSWRLVCDLIHRLCVTGIWLGYRPSSLGRIFTGSYSLPPSLVAIWSFNTWVAPHEVARQIHTVALKKIASYVEDWAQKPVMPQYVARLISIHAWGLLQHSFSRISLFLLISKWAPKFVKLEMYDL
jgi:hypothetical protein